MYAAVRGYTEIMEQLLKYPFDVNAKKMVSISE